MRDTGNRMNARPAWVDMRLKEYEAQAKLQKREFWCFQECMVMIVSPVQECV